MSFKKCKVVMLTTNEKATLITDGNYNHEIISKNNLINPDPNRFKGYELYITSDDEIKEGDWVLTPNNEIKKFGEIGTYLSRDKKIIATTDSSLTKEMYSISFGKYQEPLPQLSQSFIEKYVGEYNKNNVITDVLVEYETYHGINTSIAEVNYISGDGSLGWQGNNDLRDYKLKVNSKDNTITIKKVKDSYTKKELLLILTKFGLDVYEEYAKNKTMYNFSEEWIEENL